MYQTLYFLCFLSTNEKVQGGTKKHPFVVLYPRCQEVQISRKQCQTHSIYFIIHSKTDTNTLY